MSIKDANESSLTIKTSLKTQRSSEFFLSLKPLLTVLDWNLLFDVFMGTISFLSGVHGDTVMNQLQGFLPFFSPYFTMLCVISCIDCVCTLTFSHHCVHALQHCGCLHW